MNPFDFVPLDIKHPPMRCTPVWHNVLVPDKRLGTKLYTGYLYLYIKAETPIFIGTSIPHQASQDPREPQQHIQNKWDEYIIPGTSIKGLLRTVVETVCNGCMTKFSPPREHSRNTLPAGFEACNHNRSLCIACRLFGMMHSKKRESAVFMGKVNIGDALAYDDMPEFHDPIYTIVLDVPKPRHKAFYLDEQERYIAGRKFYFHNQELLTENRLIPVLSKSGKSQETRYRNRYIEPLDTGTDFGARIDFANLTADEFAALLYAIQLQPDMRHKLGYGKPMGLGSVQLSITELQLVDFSSRYRTIRGNRGITSYKDDDLYDLLDQQLAPIDEQISRHWNYFRSLPAIKRLYDIWKWPPEKNVFYGYPDPDWFKQNPRARISETKYLYP